MRKWYRRIMYRARLRASTALDPVAAAPSEPARASLFSTHADVGPHKLPAPRLDWPVPKLILGRDVVTIGADGREVATTDANDVENSVKPGYGNAYGVIPEVQLNWYGAQGFIGYQMMSLLAQHWLIEKACAMPAKDAMRKGYSLSLNDGTKIQPDVIDFISDIDKLMKIKHQCIEFIRKGRIFGIRVAKFVVESDDPDYYTKPFNLDGVKPGAYKGIVQIDPYWIVPELSSEETLQPGSLHFYQPTFWRINGTSIHRSHLVIYTTGEVPDVLKPSYYYGGVSITQRIYERVYAAERSANEAPMLLMTKRLTVLNTDIEQALADQQKFDQRMAWWSETRDNFGVKINATEDQITQHDTTLTNVDSVTLTQYQLVAAIAEVPGTKLIGTQPKGFNSTGEYEEASYHEMLESLQSNDIEPLLNRHHALVQQSYVVPKFGGKVLNFIVSWAELDAMTAQEQAAVNLTRLQGDAVGISIGALGAEDARKRLVNDPDSGYSGISDKLPPLPDDNGDGGGGGADPDNPSNGPIAPKPRIQAANIGPKGA